MSAPLMAPLTYEGHYLPPGRPHLPPSRVPVIGWWASDQYDDIDELSCSLVPEYEFVPRHFGEYTYESERPLHEFAVGDIVLYRSDTLKTVVRTTVTALLPNGDYDLSRKKRASASKIMPLLQSRCLDDELELVRPASLSLPAMEEVQSTSLPLPAVEEVRPVVEQVLTVPSIAALAAAIQEGCKEMFTPRDFDETQLPSPLRSRRRTAPSLYPDDVPLACKPSLGGVHPLASEIFYDAIEADEREQEDMSFGELIESEQGDISFGEADESEQEDMSFGELNEREHEEACFGELNEREQDEASFGALNEREHEVASFGQREEREHEEASFGEPCEREQDDISFGKPCEREQEEASSGELNEREQEEASIGEPDERKHEEASFGQPSEREQEEANFGEPDEREHEKQNHKDEDEREQEENQEGEDEHEQEDRDEYVEELDSARVHDDVKELCVPQVPAMECDVHHGTAFSVKALMEYDHVPKYFAQEMLALVSLCAPTCDENSRAPVDLSLIIDTGSMDAKLELVLEACRFVVSQLNERDRLAVVVYDAHVTELTPSRYMDSDAKRKLEEKLCTVQPASASSSGLLKGLKEHRSMGESGRGSEVTIGHRVEDVDGGERVVLFVTQTENVIEKVNFTVRSDVPSATSVEVDVLCAPFETRDTGFLQALYGGICVITVTFKDGAERVYEHRVKRGEDQMQSVAWNQNQARTAILFTDGEANHGLKSTAEVVSAAKDLMECIGACTVNCVGFGDEHNCDMLSDLAKACGGDYLYVENEDAIPTAFAHMLGGMLSLFAHNIVVDVRSSYVTQYPDFARNGTVLSLGDMFAEERRDLVFHVSPEARQTDLGSVRVRYFNLFSSAWEEKEVPLTITRTTTLAPSNPALEFHRDRVQVVECLRQAKKLGMDGRFRESFVIIHRQLNRMAECDERSERLVVHLKDALCGLEDRPTFERYNRILTSRINEYTKQRAMGPASGYQLPSQVLMQQKARAWFTKA